MLSGLGIGAVTATAMAWLAELRGTGRRHTQVVATAANLGGLGLGGLIAGALAQWVGDPLRVPFAVFTVALVLAWVALLAVPETRGRQVATDSGSTRESPRPRYRPQRVSVPTASRGRFFAAALGAAIAFAVFGLLTSLAPSFLAGTLHQPSHLLAGTVSFAVFAAAALAQTLAASRATQQLLATAIPTLLAGLGMLTLAVWLPAPSFGVFLGGDLVVGIGSGLMFKGAIATVSEIAAADHRAEALAGLYLACYLGLAGPVIGLGVLTQDRLRARQPARVRRAAGARDSRRHPRAARPPRPPPILAITTRLHLTGATMHQTALNTTQLGQTGLEITRVGFGAWAIGGGGWEFGWGSQDDEESIAAIHHALELGVNWIDTAAAYGFGHSEEVVGRALDGLTERPYVFTKCSLLEGPDRRVVHSLKRDSILREAERQPRAARRRRDRPLPDPLADPRARTSRRGGRRSPSSKSKASCATSASPTSTSSSCGGSSRSRPSRRSSRSTR